MGKAMLTAMQREERKTGIGSSDAAAILGVSSWNSALGVWAEKTGRWVPPDISGEPFIEWGNRMEPVIGAAYAERMGVALKKPDTIRDAKRPHMLAHLDFATAERVVEAKTANQFMAPQWGEPGTDEVPEQYLVQVMHQMIVTGLRMADIAVLIGGSDFRIYTVPFNEQLAEILIQRESAFWKFVEAKQEPEIDFAHQSTAALLSAIYRPIEGATITLPNEASSLAAEYEDLGVAIKELEAAREAAKNQLTAMQREAAEGVLPDGRIVSRKLIQRAAYSVEAGEYTRFSIKSKQSKSLKQARCDAHLAFDPLWQRGDRTRKGAYAWLAEQMELTADECHMSLMSESQCKTVIELCSRQPLTK